MVDIPIIIITLHAVELSWIELRVDQYKYDPRKITINYRTKWILEFNCVFPVDTHFYLVFVSYILNYHPKRDI